MRKNLLELKCADCLNPVEFSVEAGALMIYPCPCQLDENTARLVTGIEKLIEKLEPQRKE